MHVNFVSLFQVKRDPKSGQSKGYGFIRFSKYDDQIRCMSTRHHIDGRWCDVTIPNSNVTAFMIYYLIHVSLEVNVVLKGC